MSQHYDLAIRVDAIDPSGILGVLSADGGAFLAVKEMEDDNPHIHVYLRSKRKLPAVRAAIKRAMPELNGNGSYSVALCRDVDRYLRYMMKGDAASTMPQVVGAFGLQFSDAAWQSETHDAYWAENEEIGRRRKMVPVAEAVLQACKAANIRWDARETISEMYIRELFSRDKAINLFSVRSHVSLLQCKLCPDDSAIKHLAAHCVNY